MLSNMDVVFFIIIQQELTDAEKGILWINAEEIIKSSRIVCRRVNKPD